MSTIRLGAFDLVSAFAKGGQGQIWGARHREQGTRAAVKVLTEEGRRDESTVRALQDEVRAVASVEHPSIVQVFDAGTIDDRTARRSQGQLPAGSPYLVMEYASGGSLLNLPGLLPWSELRNTLLILLDALSYAHANGLIHRDLKLGNVLISSRHDHRPGLKLTDFGIAAIGLDERRGDDFEQPVGTLRYMAPEQIRGAWRDQGPWTDLFGLGSVAWRLATGRTPFADKQGQELIQAQLYSNPPRLPRRTPVPDGFEDWLMSMLAKRPEDRPTSAAHAAYLLRGLPPCGDVRPPILSLQVDLGAQAAAADPWNGTVSPSQHTIRPPLRTPVPRAWRGPQSSAPSLELLGTGQALFGVKRRALVGRDVELRAMWKALRHTATSGSTEILLVRGPHGVGTSEVVRAFCEAAAARAGARVIAHTATEDAPKGEVVRSLLSRWLRVGGLPREETASRIRMHLETGSLPRREHRAFAQDAADAVISRPDASPEPDRRYAVVEQLLRYIPEPGVVVLCIDDAPLDDEALQLLAHLADADDLGPLMLIATAHVEHLGANPYAAQLLHDLSGMDHTTIIDMSPLDERTMRELVNESLGLEETLAIEIAASSGGLPSYAVQVVQNLVESNALMLGEDGFQLRHGHSLPLHEGAETLWSRAADTTLAGLPPGAEVVLELVGILQTPLHEPTWVGTATRVQASSGALVGIVAQRLARLGLLKRDGEHWLCEQTGFRNHLRARAQRSGHATVLHLAAATHRIHRGQARYPGDAEQLGLHLYEGEAYEESIPWLLTGALERAQISGDHAAIPLAEKCAEALARSNILPSDSRHGQVQLVRAKLLRNTKSPELATAVTNALWQKVCAHGWTPLVTEVLLERARCASAAGDIETARAAIHQLNLEVGNLPDPQSRGHVLQSMAEWYVTDADLSNARRFYDAAATAYTAAGDTSACAIAWRELALVELRAGVLESASLLLRRAHATRADDRSHAPRCQIALGEVCRRRGESEAARRWFDRGLAATQALSRREAIGAHLGLAKLHLAALEWSQAHAHLLRARRAAYAFHDTSTVATVDILRLPCLAAREDWEAWQQVLGGVTQPVPADSDLLDAAQLAASLAERKGEPDRQREALELALALAHRLGDLFAVLRLQGQLAAAGASPDAANREDDASQEPTPIS